MAANLRTSDEQWVWRGDASSSILVAGHSHRGAYRAAVDKGLAPGVAVLVRRESPDPSAPPQWDDTYWRTAAEAPGRVLALAWRGAQHNVHFLLNLAEPLRLHDCGELGKAVPASMISAVWEESLDGLDSVVSSARAEHVVVLGSPPPKSDEAVRAGLTHSPIFAPFAAAGVDPDTIRITPAPVRVGLWRILQADLEARAARLGAIFVPVPARAQTADGCLKPEYSVLDVSHANAAYAVLMLSEIEGALARAGVSQR